jgi:hypothetical protein
MAAALSGCAYRSIAVNNVGSGPIQDVNIRTRSGDFDVRYGIVAVNPHPEVPGKTFRGDMRIKRSDICIVNWTDASGQKHEAQIDLSKERQLSGGGGLLFNVHDDAVQTRSFKD